MRRREDGQVAGDCQPPLPRDGAADVGRIAGRFATGGPEIDRDQRRREVERLEPARVPLRREPVALRVRLGVSELGMVVEVPTGELGRRDPAWKRVEVTQEAVAAVLTRVEDEPVHDFVQHHGEVEDRESHDQRRRNPDPPFGRSPGDRARPEQQQELPAQDQKVQQGPPSDGGASAPPTAPPRRAAPAGRRCDRPSTNASAPRFPCPAGMVLPGGAAAGADRGCDRGPL